MRLKNVLIVVNDIEKSKKFYKDLFGLDVILDNDGNVILTEGLVLQDAKVWMDFIRKNIVKKNNATELYFEEKNIEAFAKKLEAYEEPIEYVNPLMEHSWGQKVIRFYDLDGNLIEVGTPMDTPMPDEIEAIARANDSIQKKGTVSHEDINWD